MKAWFMPHGLRQKAAIAVGLMSVLPLLVLGVVVTNHVFPNQKAIWEVSWLVMGAIFVSLLGYWLIRQVVLPIVRISRDLRAIAEGGLVEYPAFPKGPGELGDLGSALNALTKRARELEIFDPLTGLYNAAYMRSRLEEEIQRAIRYHRPCSLVILNLDHFKSLDESHGRLEAESILRQIAQVIEQESTVVDRVGRLGPDEFALILPEQNKRESIALAQTIRKKIEETRFQIGNGQTFFPSLTISGGIAENPLDGQTAQELWTKASQAVKLAKKQGRNRIVAN